MTAPLPAPKTGITRTSLYRYFPPAQPNRSPQDNRPSDCRTPERRILHNCTSDPVLYAMLRDPKPYQQTDHQK